MALCSFARRTASKVRPFLRLLLPPFPACSSTTQSSDLEVFPKEPTASPSDPQLLHLLGLISKARETEFPSGGSALAFLRASGVGPTRTLVLSALWELRRDWESAFLALRWGEECVGECAGAWDLMVWASAREGRFDVAWSVIRRMHRRKVPVRRALSIVMERYVAFNQVSKAIKTFHAMEKFDIFANPHVLYDLLQALCKHKYVEEAEQLLFLDRKLFPLETKGFNIILDGWCNIVEDLVEAKRVWREMSACCVCPDEVSYSHMICCSSKAGNLYDSLRLYDGMQKRNLVPDLTIYNSLLYVLTRENCLNKAYTILDKIKKAGLQADATTYNSIIHPLCEMHKLEEAHDVLRKMLANDLEPTIETFNALAMVEGMFGTLDLIENMRSVGCDPSKETFLIILNKFFRLNQPVNALKVWTDMRKHKVIPDFELYHALVKGLLDCKWFSRAQECYEEMVSKGFAGDPKFDKIFKQRRLSLEISSSWKDKQVEQANTH